MKYKIERTEKKTTQAGKPFIKATLKDEEQQILDDVLIWSDFPDFERITPGAEAEGVIRTSARGYKNLKPTRFPYPRVEMPEKASHTSATETYPERSYRPYERTRDRNIQLPDNRSLEIRAAQERKNHAIAYFNATNSAIALVSHMKNKLTHPVNRTVLKQEIEYWRDWFIEEWRGYESRGYENRNNYNSSYED